MISTKKRGILGAIVGDMIGSPYEWHRIKTTEFPLFSPKSEFTDDSVMTIAVADAFLNRTSYQEVFLRWGHLYPDAGYGGFFSQWLDSPAPAPYNSFGNGSAMRVSPIGFLVDSLEAVLEEAKLTALPTHNHPEGIKGAQATASAIFLARTGKSKTEIKEYISKHFSYNLNRRLDDIRPSYSFDETCQKTVPEAIIAFLEADTYEMAVRNAVSLGGDSDTLACITGGIAAAFFGLPDEIALEARKRLPKEMLTILDSITEK